MDNSTLTLEEQLIVELSKLDLGSSERTKVFQILNESALDWSYILNVSIKNKIPGLVWHHMLQLGLQKKIPSRIRQVFLFIYMGIRERTTAYIQEAEIIGSKLSQHSIRHAFLKGSYLLPNMYKTYGVRNMNDIDILIKHSDTKRIVDVMNELGYIQGEYDESKGLIEAIDPRKQILWKSKMNNMFPFIKKSTSDYIHCFKIDFCFSLDLNLRKEEVENILDASTKNDLPAADFFLHLCCHFYKEATNAMWIYNINDITFIKLCDIREFIRLKMTEQSLHEAIQKAIQLGHNHAMYYSLYCLKFVYNDGYEEEQMRRLHVSDESFINFFGGKDFVYSKEWKKSIWQRLFSIDNKDELEGVSPKYNLLS